MAVISCPSCNKKISNKAGVCSYCQIDLNNLDAEKLSTLAQTNFIKKSQRLIETFQFEIHIHDSARSLNLRIIKAIKEDIINGYVVTIDDTTSLILAEKHAAWSDIAKKIAHEVKNPLTPIKLSAERIEKKIQNKSINSDEDLINYSKKMIKTNWHPVGTCKMGKDNDDMAVLNTKLEVKGIKNLRVFDVSMMPTIVGANTNAPAMAIADKATDIMLEN